MIKQKQKTGLVILSYIVAPFSWSDWEDTCTFTFNNKTYLVQAKENSKTKVHKFKVIPIIK